MPESKNVIDLKAAKEKRETDALIQDMLSSPRIDPCLELSGKNIVLGWSVLGYENGAKLNVVIHENPGDGIPCTTLGVFACDENQWKKFVSEGDAILAAHAKTFAK